MQYKTIVLQLLEDRPQIYDQLRTKRMVLVALNLYASQLKSSHEAWKDRLSQAKPGSNESQIASEALEIALKELEDRLPSEFLLDDNDPFSLADAMAFISRHSPPA